MIERRAFRQYDYCGDDGLVEAGGGYLRGATLWRRCGSRDY